MKSIPGSGEGGVFREGRLSSRVSGEYKYLTKWAMCI